jgi:hypothetical protein
MQTEQGNMLLSLHAVKAYLNENAARFAGVVQTGTRQRLDDGILALSEHVTEQSGNALAAKASTQTQRELRTVLLRDHMAPIARIARADLPRAPQFAALRMPRGRPSIPKLAAAATGMAREAANHADIFVAAALPADFAEQLDQASQALVESANARVLTTGRRTRATSGLRSKLTEGRRIVHVLDALVKKTLKNDEPELLREWNYVKRVPRTRGRGITTPAIAPVVAPDVTIPAPAIAGADPQPGGATS